MRKVLLLLITFYIREKGGRQQVAHLVVIVTQFELSLPCASTLNHDKLSVKKIQ